MYIHQVSFIYSSINEHLGCFLILVAVNNAAVNIGVHISFWIRVFAFFRYILRGATAGSYGSPISCFWRTLHTVLFHSGCNNLHSQQQCTRVPFPPLPHQCLLLVNFTMIAILRGVKWYVIVVLICISLMLSNFEHFSMYLFAIRVSLEKCLFMSCAHFLTRLFVGFLILSTWLFICFGY